jgi:hypothetical protein
VDLLEQLWRIPVVAKIFSYAYDEEKMRIRDIPKKTKVFRDGLDSELWEKEVTPHLLKNPFTFVFSLTRDGIQVTHKGTKSVSPLLVTPRSIHPAFIKVFIMLIQIESVPQLSKAEKKKCATHRKHHAPIPTVFNLLIEELIENELHPRKMKNGYTGDEGELKFILLNFCGDSRALPSVTMGNYAPSFIGSCPECDVEGTASGKSRYFIGHICWLSKESKTGVEYRDLFQDSKVYLKYLDQNKPKLKTHKDVLKRQQQAAKDNENKIDYYSKDHSRKKHGGGYGGLTNFLELSYWDLVKSPAYCLIHELGNGMQQLFDLLQNYGQMKFTKSRLAAEHKRDVLKI